MQVKRLSVFHQMLEKSSHKGNYMPESTGIAGFSGRKRVGELRVTSYGGTSDERRRDGGRRRELQVTSDGVTEGEAGSYELQVTEGRRAEQM